MPAWVEQYLENMPWAAHPLILAVLGIIVCLIGGLLFHDVTNWEAAGRTGRLNVFTLLFYRIGGKPMVLFACVAIAFVPWTAAYYLHRARRT